MRTFRWAAILPVAAFAAFLATAQETKLKYPQTKKVDVVEDYHGTKVADPFRWLEDDVRKSSKPQTPNPRKQINDQIKKSYIKSNI